MHDQKARDVASMAAENLIGIVGRFRNRWEREKAWGAIYTAVLAAIEVHDILKARAGMNAMPSRN